MARCRTARALVAVGALVITAAVVAPAAGAKTAPAPDGYTTTAVKAAGVTFAIPETWLAIDPKSQSSAEALQAAADKNPQLTGLVSQFQTIRSSIKYWAIDAGATSFATNLLVLPTPFDRAALQQPAAVKRNLQSSLGTNVDSLTVKKVKVDKTPALEAGATIRITGADGSPITAYATILFVNTKKGVIDLDYTGSAPPASDETLATIVKSIDLT